MTFEPERDVPNTPGYDMALESLKWKSPTWLRADKPVIDIFKLNRQPDEPHFFIRAPWFSAGSVI
jgi:hypothetical protein